MANETARSLRKRLTPQEVKLWVKLRELKTLGFRFRRQAPIGQYIIDFVSLTDRVAIEITAVSTQWLKAFGQTKNEIDFFSREASVFCAIGIRTWIEISVV